MHTTSILYMASLLCQVLAKSGTVHSSFGNGTTAPRAHKNGLPFANMTGSNTSKSAKLPTSDHNPLDLGSSMVNISSTSSDARNSRTSEEGFSFTEEQASSTDTTFSSMNATWNSTRFTSLPKAPTNKTAAVPTSLIMSESGSRLVLPSSRLGANPIDDPLIFGNPSRVSSGSKPTAKPGSSSASRTAIVQESSLSDSSMLEPSPRPAVTRTSSALHTSSGTTTNDTALLLSITSTMTTVPTVVSTQLITSGGLTTNTWIETRKDAESSTVPVVWCPECGGAVIIWGFPKVTGVLFNWPILHLPEFSFPCIPLPFEPCSNPPSSRDDKDDNQSSSDDDGDDEDDESSDRNEDDQGNQGGEEEEDDDDNRPSSTLTSTEEATSSSTSSCSAGTTAISECRIACSISTKPTEMPHPETSIDGVFATTTTVCYTTTCTPVTGCDIVPTTTSTISSDSSAGPSCAFDSATAYNAFASYKAMGMPLPIWLEYPITHVGSTSIQSTTTGKGKGKATGDPNDEDATLTSVSATATEVSTTITRRTESSTALSNNLDTIGSTNSSRAASPTRSEAGQTTGSSNVSHPNNATSSETFSGDRSSSSSRASSDTSSTATSSVKSAQKPSETPIFGANPSCWDEAEFPGHAPIDPAFVDDAATYYCGTFEENELSSNSPSISKNYRADNSVNYLLKVERRPGCSEQEAEGESKRSCQSLLIDTYSKCNNGGVGGSVDAGCLRYSFTGGLGDDQVPDPEQIPSSDDGGESDKGFTSPPQSGSEPEPDPIPESTPVPTPESIVTPLTIEPVVCNDGNFDHDDVHPVIVKEGSTLACADCSGNLAPGESSACGDGLQNLSFEVSWIDGCTTTESSQSAKDLIGDGGQTCASLLRSTYDGCNNGGAAGYVDAGCLRYNVTVMY